MAARAVPTTPLSSLASNSIQKRPLTCIEEQECRAGNLSNRKPCGAHRPEERQPARSLLNVVSRPTDGSSMAMGFPPGAVLHRPDHAGGVLVDLALWSVRRRMPCGWSDLERLRIQQSIGSSFSTNHWKSGRLSRLGCSYLRARSRLDLQHCLRSALDCPGNLWKQDGRISLSFCKSAIPNTVRQARRASVAIAGSCSISITTLSPIGNPRIFSQQLFTLCGQVLQAKIKLQHSCVICLFSSKRRASQ